MDQPMLRFWLSGSVGVILGLIVVQLLAHLGLSIWPASTAGYLVSITSNYLMHRHWTFSRSGTIWKGGLAALFIYLITVSVAWAIYHEAGIPAWSAHWAGVIVAWPVNWWAHSRWIFPALAP